MSHLNVASVSEQHNPSSSDLKATSSVHDVLQDRPPFGSRFLTEDVDVWSQNSWDHVPPPSDQDEIIAASLTKQKSHPVPVEDHPHYNDHPQTHWDSFYKSNTSNFFKNRKWLSTEFPDLMQTLSPQAGPKVIVELGCGAGNAVFPLHEANENPEASFKAYDYSAQAIKVVQQNPAYATAPPGTLAASVWDLASDSIPLDLVEGSVDIVLLIFVLSALHPDEWTQALSNIYRILKPGGLVLLRDYGRYDLTQLRFKTGRLLDDNFYIRGDKTRVYFFEIDELSLLFSGAKPATTPTVTDSVGMSEEIDDEPSGPSAEALQDEALGSSPSNSQTHILLQGSIVIPHCPPHPLFSVQKLGVDRRLIINRSRKLKMYRVWMQGVFQKV